MFTVHDPEMSGHPLGALPYRNLGCSNSIKNGRAAIDEFLTLRSYLWTPRNGLPGRLAFRKRGPATGGTYRPIR